ncbi:MAG: hypothetical protein IKA36_06125 [Clostridia bacterium]|nr:hypothetical protein [Clostridia bacterium]
MTDKEDSYEQSKGPTQAEMFATVRDFMISEKEYTGAFTVNMSVFEYVDNKEELSSRMIASYDIDERKFSYRSFEPTESGNSQEVYCNFYLEENGKNIIYEYGEDWYNYQYNYVGDDYFDYFAENDFSGPYTYLMPFDENVNTLSDYANNYLDNIGEFSSEDQIEKQSSIKFEDGKYIINLIFTVTNERISGEAIAESNIIIDIENKYVEEYITTSSTYESDEGTVTDKNSGKATYVHEYDSSIDMTLVEKSTMKDIENIKTSIEYYIDGDYYESGDPTEFGTEITLEDCKRENTTRSIWFMDSECTIPCTLTTQPSYDLELYAKSIPNDGYYLLKVGQGFETGYEWVYEVKVLPILNNDISQYITFVDTNEYVSSDEADEYNYEWFIGEGNYSLTYNYKVKINGIEVNSNTYNFLSARTYFMERELVSISGVKLAD